MIKALKKIIGVIVTILAIAVLLFAALSTVAYLISIYLVPL